MNPAATDSTLLMRVGRMYMTVAPCSFTETKARYEAYHGNILTELSAIDPRTYFDQRAKIDPATIVPVSETHKGRRIIIDRGDSKPEDVAETLLHGTHHRIGEIALLSEQYRLARNADFVLLDLNGKAG